METTTYETEERIDDLLCEAFAASEYLHAPGVGDRQAIVLVLDRAANMTGAASTIKYLVAGAVQARAMCEYEIADYVAEALYYEIVLGEETV